MFLHTIKWSIHFNSNDLSWSDPICTILRKPEDQVALYAFAYSYRRLSDLTEDRLKIAKLLSNLRAESGTDVYGTLYDAARYLKAKAPHRRRALILISDNCHADGAISAEMSRNESLETATTLYNIVTPSMHTNMPFCRQSNPEVQRTAKETGGEVMDVQGPMSLKGALEKTISSLRMRYTLGFNPSNPGYQGSFHRLTVQFANKDRCPNCRIIGRKGYYAGIAPSLPLTDAVGKKPRPSSQEIDEALIQLGILVAGANSRNLTEIPLELSTAEQTDSSGQPQIKIDLRIGPAGIDFAAVEDRHDFKLFVAVFYADKKGKLLGRVIKRIEGQLSEEGYGQIAETGISFSASVPIKTNNQAIKVVVYDERSDRISTKFIQLQNKVNSR
jgi:hypothetical protein